jgi:hypothetical protein
MSFMFASLRFAVPLLSSSTTSSFLCIHLSSAFGLDDADCSVIARISLLSPVQWAELKDQV